MIVYSPLVPLLSGVLLLAVAAFMTTPPKQAQAHGQGPGRKILANLGLVLILPAYGLMTPLGANLLVLVIEQRIKTAESNATCQQVQLGVLLSGGLNRPARTADDFAALTEESLSRSFAWSERLATGDLVTSDWVIAGGGPFRLAEAEVIGALLHRLEPDQPPPQRESASTTTRESAQALRIMLPDSTRRIALASSALHLPRARFAFEQAGFEVCPVVLHRHYLATSNWTSLLPHSSALSKSESALHELLGELHYRLSPPSCQPPGPEAAGRRGPIGGDQANESHEAGPTSDP